MANADHPHGSLAHIAINADDMDRTMAFYSGLFGWRFNRWGPPDSNFYQIDRPTAPVVRAAMQERREIGDGSRMTGFECTIAVDDLAATLARVTELGGRIVSEPFTIPTVGTLAWLEDPSGNAVGVMQYEPAT
jgi:predicted enzyme related to lactoylglutathione lyase